MIWPNSLDSTLFPHHACDLTSIFFPNTSMHLILEAILDDEICLLLMMNFKDASFIDGIDLIVMIYVFRYKIMSKSIWWISTVKFMGANFFFKPPKFKKIFAFILIISTQQVLISMHFLFLFFISWFILLFMYVTACLWWCLRKVELVKKKYIS